MLEPISLLKMLFIPLADDREGAVEGYPCGSKPMSDLTAKHLERAEKALQRGKPDLALAEYLAILEEDPSNEAAYHTAADVSVSLGRNTEAVKLLSNLFEHQCARSDTAKASITYKKLSRITRPTGEQSLIFANNLAKNNKEALKAYEAAFQAFIGKTRKRDALIALNGIVALAPSTDNFRKQGELAAELGFNEEAAAAYLAAGELESDADSRFVFLERAYKLAPDEIRIAVTCGEALLSRGNPERAAAVIEPFAILSDAPIEPRSLYGRALLSAREPGRAIPFLWSLFEIDPSHLDKVIDAITGIAAGADPGSALAWIRRLEQHEHQRGRRREFITLLKSLADKTAPTLEFLEYLADAFDSANREHDYSDTLIKLFDLHYASGSYAQAAACLDRAAEVDAYEPGHASRLEMLRGKVDAKQFKSVAARLRLAVSASGQDKEQAEPAAEAENTSLDDLMAQAEIYFRYSMDAKAIEKLNRIQKLFPGAEHNRSELQELYARAGLLTPAPVYKTPEPVQDRGHDRRHEESAPVDDIRRVTEITANLFRQTTVKNVLFACVNDAGRHWKASRCLAVLSTPGKPPSVALEYCAPGIQQLDIHSIVKLVGLLQPLALAHGALQVCNTKSTKPVLRALKKPLAAMGIESLLSVPLVKGEDHIGLLALAQCDRPCEWAAQDTAILNAIAEQVELAVSNTQLRKLVRDLAVTEGNTGLVKRSCYMDVVQSEISAGLRQNSPTSLMLMNFGKPSDLVRQSGQQGLETLMRHLAALITSHVRQNDVAIRYGETTIALILADTLGKDAALAAEKLRKVAAVATVPGCDTPPQITVGIAQAVLQPSYDPADITTEVVNRAEYALCQAIDIGGNRTNLIAFAG